MQISAAEEEQSHRLHIVGPTRIEADRWRQIGCQKKRIVQGGVSYTNIVGGLDGQCDQEWTIFCKEQ